MILWYKNSFLASAVSILGCIIGLTGISLLFDGESTMGSIVMIVVCLVLIGLGHEISDSKANKKWLKELQSKGLDAQVRASNELATRLYNANPCPFTLKYIQSVNPAAAQEIARHIKK